MEETEKSANNATRTKYISKAINNGLCSENSLRQIHKWKYPHVAELLKCDECFNALRQTVKLLEIDGFQFLKTITSSTLPLWCNDFDDTHRRAIHALSEEILHFLQLPNDSLELEETKDQQEKNQKRFFESLYSDDDDSSTTGNNTYTLLHRRLSKVRTNHRPTRRMSAPPQEQTLEDFFPKLENEDFTNENSRKQEAKSLNATKKKQSYEKVVISYTSGSKRIGFTEKVLSLICQLIPRKDSVTPRHLVWEKQESLTSDEKNALTDDVDSETVYNPWYSKETPKDAVMVFRKTQKQFDSLVCLIVPSDLNRPTLKLLYCLTTCQYILLDTFLEEAMSLQLWPIPSRHEHPNWPTVVSRRQNRKLMKNLTFTTIGPFEPPSMSQQDVITLMELLGATYEQPNLVKHCDIVIVSDNVSLSDLTRIRRILESQQANNEQDNVNDDDCFNNKEKPSFVSVLWLIESINAWSIKDTKYFQHIAARLARSKPTELVNSDSIATRGVCRKSLENNSLPSLSPSHKRPKLIKDTAIKRVIDEATASSDKTRTENDLSSCDTTLTQTLPNKDDNAQEESSLKFEKFEEKPTNIKCFEPPKSELVSELPVYEKAGAAAVPTESSPKCKDHTQSSFLLRRRRNRASAELL